MRLVGYLKINLLLLDMFRSWVSHELRCFVVTTGVDEVLADPAVQNFRLQMCRIRTFAVGSFRLDHVLLTEGSILDPCFGIWE